MRDTEFVRGLLRVEDPWDVVESKLDLDRQRVDVRIEWQGPGRCPVCSAEVPKHDHRERVWRDLDLCTDQLFIHALVPRVDCPEHGVLTVKVPWAQGRTEFTDRFEAVVIAYLGEMSIAGLSRRMRLTWDQIDGVMSRAVERGLKCRQEETYRYIGVDEKAVKRGHKYFTVVSDLERSKVLYIGRGRKREALDPFWRGLSAAQLGGIEGIAMDMWQPFYESAILHVPGAKQKIVFDRFHIAKYLADAVDATRKLVLRELGGDAASLKGSKYDWLRNPRNMDHSDKIALARLRGEYDKLGRAWTLKELFSGFWEYRRESAARTFFDAWYGWAVRSRLPAIAKVAKMIKRHFENIISYLRIRITNAAAEGLNSKIQWIKYQARGFRSEDRFERAILFHCGGLHLLPTHHNS